MSMATRVMIIEDDLAIAELHHKYLSQLTGFGSGRNCDHENGSGNATRHS